MVHIGPGGAGHYVKMIHNGIEYGDMQLICEAYALLQAAGLSNARMAACVRPVEPGRTAELPDPDHRQARWNRSMPRPAAMWSDLILDKAGQKGTGQWTQLNAAENAVVISTINAAVEARVLSSQKDQRVAASRQLAGPGRPCWTSTPSS